MLQMYIVSPEIMYDVRSGVDFVPLPPDVPSKTEKVTVKDEPFPFVFIQKYQTFDDMVRIPMWHVFATTETYHLDIYEPNVPANITLAFPMMTYRQAMINYSRNNYLDHSITFRMRNTIVQSSNFDVLLPTVYLKEPFDWKLYKNNQLVAYGSYCLQFKYD
jgi:hypothetical protein